MPTVVLEEQVVHFRTSQHISEMSRMHKGEKLPPGWIKCQSEKYGRPYFFDTQTNKSRWFPPDAVKDSTKQPSQLQPQVPQNISQGFEGGRKRSHEDSSTMGKAKHSRLLGDMSGRTPSAAGDRDGVKVAIIVPYRDLHPAQRRAEHLRQFVPFMEAFLQKHGVTSFRVYIVEQSMDDRKFNRGKLLNVGFDLAKNEGCEAFLFHDVDLLPSDELGKWYSSRPSRPVHVARVWKQYSNNPKYFGGVVAFNREDFEAINGFPNTFWGWGGEDDEMYSRIVEVGLRPQSAQEGEFTDLEGLGLEKKLNLLRENKDWKCQVKKEALEDHATTWRRNGLADLKYKVLSRSPLGHDSDKIMVDVKLNGHWTDTILKWEDLPKRSR